MPKNGEYNFKNVAKYFKTVKNIKDITKIFIPCYRDKHFRLVVVDICYQEKRGYIDCYDSLPRKKRKEDDDELSPTDIVWRWMEEMIYTYKVNCWDVERGALNTWDYNIRTKEFPNQNNGYDCGVYTMLAADLMSNNLPIAKRYSPEVINAYRYQIAASLVEKKLQYC
jgi:Ulp1 family protease